MARTPLAKARLGGRPLRFKPRVQLTLAIKKLVGAPVSPLRAKETAGCFSTAGKVLRCEHHRRLPAQVQFALSRQCQAGAGFNILRQLFFQLQVAGNDVHGAASGQRS